MTKWLKDGDSGAGDWRGAARFGDVWDEPLGTLRVSGGVLGATVAGDGGSWERRFAAGGTASKGRGALEAFEASEALEAKAVRAPPPPSGVRRGGRCGRGRRSDAG